MRLYRDSGLSSNLGRFVIEGRQLSVGVDNLFRFRRIFFAHQQDRSTYAWKCILHGVNGFQVRFDAGGFEQALHDDGFVFLLGVENLYQFLVGLGLGARIEARGWRVVACILR